MCVAIVGREYSEPGLQSGLVATGEKCDFASAGYEWDRVKLTSERFAY